MTAINEQRPLHGLQPTARPEPLDAVLRRTNNHASLVPEYVQGHAPSAQRRAGQVDDPAPTYFDLPAIKKPEWKWYIPTYFFLGGLSSGAYVTSVVADLPGREEDRAFVRAGRYLALGALVACFPMLIADLGRPERFHYMLRVFKPKSMMNQGAWALALYGPVAGAAALAQVVDDLAPGSRRYLRLPARILTALALPLAAYIGAYTGVLLSATNVPLWAGNRHFLGPLFFSSALSGGMAGTHLTAKMLGPVSEAGEQRLHQAEDAVGGTEAAIVAASLAELGKLARPLQSGKVGRTFQLAVGLGLLAPLALRRAARKKPWLGVLGSALAVAGAAALKWAVTEGGKESADDPRAYFEYTKGPADAEEPTVPALPAV